MNKIDENVTRMGELMVEMKQFTEPQLSEKLQQEKRFLFPLFWNVRRYLNYFEESGALRSNNGCYEVVV